MNPPLKIREPKKDELRLVYNSWQKSWSFGGRDPATPPDIWQEGANELVSRRVKESTVAVAELDGVENEVVAWMCFDLDPDTLHYVYVKSHMRRHGIASELIRRVFNLDDLEHGLLFTTRTRICEHGKRRGPKVPDGIWPRTWIYDPWT